MKAISAAPRVRLPDLLASIPVHSVDRIPRAASGEQPVGEPDRTHRLAALSGAHRRNLPVLWAWCRERTGGPVRLLAGGVPTAEPTPSIKDSGHRLALPLGAHGRPLPPGAARTLCARMPRWTTIGAIVDPLTVESPKPVEGRGEPPPALEDCLLSIWAGPFAWFVLAEPIGADEAAGLTAAAEAADRLARSRAGTSPLATVQAQRHGERHRELRRAETSGLWRLTLAAGGGDEDAALRVAALVAAALQAPDLPYTLVVGDRSAGLAELDATEALPGHFAAGSDVLAALARAPRDEIPGVRRVRRPDFDVVPETEAASDAVTLGDVLDRDERPAGAIRLPHSSLNRHTFVCGATGAGKSQTVRHLLEEATRQGLPWLVIEPAKAEYRAMATRLAGLADVVVVRPGAPTGVPVGLNPLEPAAGFPLQTHLDLVRASFLAAFQAEEPFPQVLTTALTRCYEELGWDLVLGRPDVDPETGDDRDKAFLMGTLLVRLTEHLRVHAVDADRLRHLTVIEEAHRLLRRTGAGGAVDQAVEMLAEIRAYGEGLVIAEQIPDKLIADVIKNTAVKIVHRLPARDDRDTVGATMNLSPRQSEYLVALRPGTAAVFTDGMDAPVLARMPDGTGRERRAPEPPASAALLATAVDPAAGPPASLEELVRARRLATADPRLALWAELTVVGHLVGHPQLPPGADLLRALRAHDRSHLRLCLAEAVDAAVASRSVLFARTIGPARLAAHVLAALLAGLDGGPPCPPDEPGWLAPAYRWVRVLRDLHLLAAARPEAGRHPSSARWERWLGAPVPGRTVGEQLRLTRARLVATYPETTPRRLLLGVCTPSALEDAVGARFDDPDWAARAGSALHAWPDAGWLRAYVDPATATDKTDFRPHTRGGMMPIDRENDTTPEHGDTGGDSPARGDTARAFVAEVLTTRHGLNLERWFDREVFGSVPREPVAERAADRAPVRRDESVEAPARGAGEATDDRRAARTETSSAAPDARPAEARAGAVADAPPPGGPPPDGSDVAGRDGPAWKTRQEYREQVAPLPVRGYDRESFLEKFTEVKPPEPGGPEEPAAGAGHRVLCFPEQDGFVVRDREAVKENRTLQPGEVMIRQGGEGHENDDGTISGGRYASPEGTPEQARSLPPLPAEVSPFGADVAREDRQYRVLKPYDVEAGPAANAFGRDGGGTQYLLPHSIRELLDEGVIERIGPEPMTGLIDDVRAAQQDGPAEPGRTS
ncbi:glycohydrolase toxin TNT-related protein [Micromonospora sp. LOL_025]|uniref:glycohydrolase toxin TNT-related protein n=1 Tax=Micromonospora sp. LOL_025 TaxID=3345413 RepID=UPI003A885CB3